MKKITFLAASLISFAAFSMAIMHLVGCGICKNYPSDNVFEEFAERVIENETGLEIDLSPWDEDAEEKKKEDDSD